MTGVQTCALPISAQLWRSAATPIGAREGFPQIILESIPFHAVDCMSLATKQLLREVVEHLPEDATVEDAMDRLYFLTKVTRGLEAADRGDVVSHAAARDAVLGTDETSAR